MKKAYSKPLVDVETYSLSAAIASNCSIVVHNGPALGDRQQCDDYEDPFAVDSENTFSPMAEHNVSFYEDNCDCYYSSGGQGYWMS